MSNADLSNAGIVLPNPSLPEIPKVLYTHVLNNLFSAQISQMPKVHHFSLLF